MRNLKLEDRISLNYVLLFLVLILFSNVILVYSLQRQSKKNLVSLAQNKIEDINLLYFQEKQMNLHLILTHKLWKEEKLFT